MILSEGELFTVLKLVSLKRMGLDVYKGSRRSSHGCGIHSKQVVLSPIRSFKTATQQRHHHRIGVWHQAHDDIGG
ncbi:hypothetical protein TNCV_265591 [Trichonephila clavipes]|nr:hypothetical protein TNCV_265591 [Trichonephila clavipes]